MRQYNKPAMLSLALIVILSTWSAAVSSNARASRVLGETGPAGQAETVGDPDLEPGFPVQTLHRPGTYSSGQAIHTLVGNIDDEPTAEILVTGLARGPLYAWNSDGTLQSGWPVGGGEWEVAHYPALGNLANEPAALEIVSVVIGAETVAYGGSGAVLDGWPVSLGQVGPVSLADINGDGLDEIFWGCADSQLWAYQADGTPLPGWPPPLGGSGYTPHIADLDLDGDLEIVTLDSPSAARWRLFAYHHDGLPLAGFPFLFEGPSPQFAAVGDVDGDGVPEIVVLTDWYNIRLLSATGQVEHSFPVEGDLYYGAAPALGDIDGDEIPEIVLLMNGIVHCYHGDGSACDGWPRYWPHGGGGGTFWIGNSGPVIGDVDGDLYPDVVITLQTAGIGTTGEVRVYDRWGNMHPHFPKVTNIGSGAVPAIADVDLDGRNEIVVTGSYWDGISGNFDKVWVYDLHGSNYGPIEWGQLAGGPRHQAYYPTPTLAAPGIDLYVRARSLVTAEPGETVQLSVEVGNNGSAVATSVVLTTSLDSHLVYVSDTSGIVPVVDGDRLAWALPPAAHPFRKRFTLEMQVPAQAAYGTRYPVAWHLSSSGPETDATDNVALTEVLVAHSTFTYLPFFLRASP